MLSGALLLFVYPYFAQGQSWQEISSEGIGLSGDSDFIYTAAHDFSVNYNSYLYRINRNSGQRDSLLITATDTFSFLPFYVDVSDSLTTFIGGVYDLTVNSGDTNSKRTMLVRITDKWNFYDSVILSGQGYDVVRYTKEQDTYFFSRVSLALPENKITSFGIKEFKEDTSISLNTNNGGSFDMSLEYLESINKLFVIANPGRAYVIDTANWTVDSSFFPWDSTYPYAPVVRDLFYFNDTLTALASPWGMRMYKYDDTKPAILQNIGITNNDTMGAEQYIRGCYGIARDSLLVFSTAGPFTAPPPTQTNTVTYIKVYGVNSFGEILWQRKIENGRNNLVHSQFTDDENTFIYVRSISLSSPPKPDKMIIYKLDHQGNVLSDFQFTLNQDKAFQVYPNPASSKLYYSFSDSDAISPSDKGSMIFFDHTGKKSLECKLTGKEGELEISKLKADSYFYHVLLNGILKHRGHILVSP